MFKSRFTPEQKHHILNDFDSKRYTTEDLLHKYSITLPTLYNWRHQLKKRTPRMSAQEINNIIDESNKFGIQATCAKHGLKESTLYGWRYKYSHQEQPIKSVIANKITEDQFNIEKISHETKDELAKYKEICLALTFENFTLKNIIEKMKKQSTNHKNY